MGEGIVALVVVVVACVIIWRACDYFEDGSNFVGQRMPPGVRGATINAIGSSLPELLTTFCLLFLFQDQDGYSAGIATCAGSAVFNAVIIPALVLLVVPLAKGEKISLDKRTVIRDGIFFVGAELLLIYFLRDHTLYWWMGALLMAVYALYACYMIRQYQQFNAADDEEVTPVKPQSVERLREAMPTFAVEPVKIMTPKKAWALLAGSTVVIGTACYGLSWAVLALARWWETPAYFTAVVFAAAATSVPDTVLSLKDAKQGDYDDAIANAIGSNIFDITICLGFPLLCYGLVYGNVSMSAVGTASDVQGLRIGLLAVTAVILTLFLWGKMGKAKGFALLAVYGGWLAFLAGQL